MAFVLITIAAVLIVHHLITTSNRGQIVPLYAHFEKEKVMSDKPIYERDDDEPEHCDAVVMFHDWTYGKTAAQCVLDLHTSDTKHESASPLHERGTGVLIKWLGSDHHRDNGSLGSTMIEWVDEVTGDEVGPDDPRLIPYEV